MTTRRDVVFGMGATAGYGLFGGSAQAQGLAKLNDQFKRIETESGGRLGVAVLDTQSQMRAGHHADDRFPMCSTFKMLAAASGAQTRPNRQ